MADKIDPAAAAVESPREEPGEIELRLSHEDLVLLSTIVRSYRMHGDGSFNPVIDVIQEGLDRLLLQTLRGERAALRALSASPRVSQGIAVVEAAGLLKRAYHALAAAASPPAPAWQDIATAPKDGTLIVLWLGGVWNRPSFGKWLSVINAPSDYPALWYCSDGRCAPDVPTHWMPLPSAPRAQPEAECAVDPVGQPQADRATRGA